MKLEGSCHCRAVRFSVDSNTPFPYQRCYCSICRKTNGGGGYAINIMGWADSLEVEGAEHVTVYRAVMENGVSALERRFCARCGSGLWVYHAKWPDLIHPFASAIDTPLPVPPEVVHIMTEFKASWVEPDKGSRHSHFDRYPDKSIEVWHEAMADKESG
ncbi:MAG: GFA family protein [Nitratireductor sp.]|nr:GFA family protein [Nitratireductor sp.]